MTNNRSDRTRIASSEETAEQLRVIGVHGAVEQHAGATSALSEVLTGAENAGAAIDLFDLAELTLPLYNSDQPEPQEGVAVVRRPRIAYPAATALGRQRPEHTTSERMAPMAG